MTFGLRPGIGSVSAVTRGTVFSAKLLSCLSYVSSATGHRGCQSKVWRIKRSVKRAHTVSVMARAPVARPFLHINRSRLLTDS